MTLVEVLTTMTIMAVLLAMAAPSFNRTIEQSHADVAVANLEAIWNAQRFFWLENRTYATTINQLEAADLLDPALTNGARYTYGITTADAAGFDAEADRTGSTRWTGTFTIDELGAVGGSLTSTAGATIVPGYQ